MKRLLTLALVLLPLLSMAQDDLYFTSSKKAKEAAQKRATASMTARTTPVVAPTVVDYHSNTRGEDEYNRRYVYGGQYAEDSLAARIDSVQSGYDINDPEMDYRYSRRIVRFHSPRLYALTSPYYWDLYYGWGAWDYLYDPWDPWYWHYGWGYGWSWGPWDCWYGSIWGYSHPYSWTYWGWGPGWSRPVYYANYHRNTVPREFNSSRGHMAAGNRIRTNVVGARNLNTRGSVLSSRTNVTNGRTNVGRTRTGAVVGSGTRAGGVNGNGTRAQVYNGTREGAAGRSTISGRENQVRTQVQQPQTRTQQQTRTQVQQPQTRTQQQTRTQVQQPTRTYTPATTTRSSSGGGSFGGGGGTRAGGSFGGGGGGGRSGGGRR